MEMIDIITMLFMCAGVYLIGYLKAKNERLGEFTNLVETVSDLIKIIQKVSDDLGDLEAAASEHGIKVKL